MYRISPHRLKIAYIRPDIGTVSAMRTRIQGMYMHHMCLGGSTTTPLFMNHANHDDESRQAVKTVPATAAPEAPPVPFVPYF